jgi:hypothetical protein
MNFMNTIKAFFVCLMLLITTSIFAGDSRWGWDGGCGNCPEHLSKDSLTDASWIRLGGDGSYIFPTKTNTVGYWTETDRDINGWYARGKKIIYRSSFHPPNMTDAEIAPWIIWYNKQVLERYGDKIYGIQPLNEPWLGDEWSGDPTSWAYQYKRIGASTATNRNAYFWNYAYNGPMSTTNAVTEDAVTWFKKMAYILTEVRALASAKGVKVYGPHWQSANYDASFNNIAKQCGVFHGIDVYTFGQTAGGDPLANGGWATYIDDIIPLLDGKPWACIEFHLNDEYVGGNRSAVNYTNALYIQKGVQRWGDMGVQCVLTHIGLQNWNTQINLLTSQLCGYVADRPKDSMRVIMQTLAALPAQPSPVLLGILADHNVQTEKDGQYFLDQLSAIMQTQSNLLEVVKPPVFPSVSQLQIDACSGVSGTSAKDIVTKYKGCVIVP